MPARRDVVADGRAGGVGLRRVHVATGEFDYVMLVRMRANERFNRLYAERYLPGVRQVRSFMVLKEVMSTHALPV